MVGPFHVDEKRSKVGNAGIQTLSGNDMLGIRFGRDTRGELYILTKADGKMYKLVSAGVKPQNVK